MSCKKRRIFCHCSCCLLVSVGFFPNDNLVAARYHIKKEEKIIFIVVDYLPCSFAEYFVSLAIICNNVCVKLLKNSHVIKTGR